MRLWEDPFDGYDGESVAARTYALVDGSSIQFRAPGRDDGYSLQFTSLGTGILRTPSLGASGSVCIVGMAVQAARVAGGVALISIRNSAGAEQFAVTMQSTAAGDYWFSFSRGPHTLARSRVYPQDEWMWFELRVLVHPTDGEVEWHVNEVVEFRVASANTARQGTESWDVIEIRGAGGSSSPSGYVRIDDLLVLDGSGDVDNDFPGDVAVELAHPVQDSVNPAAWNQWSGASPHAEVVDDAAAGTVDDDALTAAAGVILSELFRLRKLRRIREEVLGVTLLSDVRLAAAGAPEGFAHAVTTRQGTATAAVPQAVTSDAYAQFRDRFAVSPVSGRAWTPEEIDGAEFGVVALA